MALTLYGRYVAVSVRISSVTNTASTWRNVMYDLTLGILSTSTRTWILAFVSNAGTIRWTVWVHYTFGTTSFVWVSKVLRETLASANIVLFATNGIRSTRTRHTWCEFLSRNVGCNSYRLVVCVCVVERRFDLSKNDFVDWQADFSVNGRFLGLNVDL